MLSRIRRFLAPPVFQDEEKTRVARLLNTVLLSFLAALLVSLVILGAVSKYPPGPNEIFTLLSALLMAIVTAGLWVLARRGHLTAASRAFLMLIWVIMAYWMSAMGGLTGNVSVPVLGMTIVLAGLLLGGRAAVVFTVLSVLAIIAAYVSEAFGLLVVEYSPATWLDILFLGVPIMLTGVLLRHAMNSMTAALDRARRNEQAQLQANRELQQIRASLEERVADRTRDLAHRSAQIEAAVDVSRAMTSILDTERLSWQVVDLIRDRFALYHVGLFIVDSTNLWALYRAGSGVGGHELAEQGFRLEVGGSSLVGWCTSSGQVRVVQDVQHERGRVDHSLVPDTRSEAAFPLLARGRVSGALSVQSDRPNAFDPHIVAALEIMAEQVGVALDNARLFAESQEALEAARRAYGERSREAWTDLIQRRTGWGYVFNRESVSPAAGELRPEMEMAVREGRTVVADHPASSPTSRRSTDTGERLAVPIQVRGQVVGVLGFEKPADEAEWTAEERALLEGIVGQMGVALESAQLFAETQMRAARDRLISEATARLRQTLEVETVLQSAIREIGNALRPWSVTEVEVRMLGGGQLARVPGLGGNGQGDGKSAEVRS